MQNGSPLLKDPPLGLWNIGVCTQTDALILKDGMRAYPSGHASSKLKLQFIVYLTFSALLFLDGRTFVLTVIRRLPPYSCVRRLGIHSAVDGWQDACL